MREWIEICCGPLFTHIYPALIACISHSAPLRNQCNEDTGLWKFLVVAVRTGITVCFLALHPWSFCCQDYYPPFRIWEEMKKKSPSRKVGCLFSSISFILVGCAREDAVKMDLFDPAHNIEVPPCFSYTVWVYHSAARDKKKRFLSPPASRCAFTSAKEGHWWDLQQVYAEWCLCEIPVAQWRLLMAVENPLSCR